MAPCPIPSGWAVANGDANSDHDTYNDADANRDAHVNSNYDTYRYTNCDCNRDAYRHANDDTHGNANGDRNHDADSDADAGRDRHGYNLPQTGHPGRANKDPPGTGAKWASRSWRLRWGMFGTTDAYQPCATYRNTAWPDQYTNTGQRWPSNDLPQTGHPGAADKDYPGFSTIWTSGSWRHNGGLPISPRAEPNPGR